MKNLTHGQKKNRGGGGRRKFLIELLLRGHQLRGRSVHFYQEERGGAGMGGDSMHPVRAQKMTHKNNKRGMARARGEVQSWQKTRAFFKQPGNQRVIGGGGNRSLGTEGQWSRLVVEFADPGNSKFHSIKKPKWDDKRH